MRNEKGFTLVELIVVMAIFIVVILMISYSFENILRQSGQQAKSAMTQIEGIVGLEMLRTDVAHAGFALPWSGTPAAVYSEVTASPVPGLTITGRLPSDAALGASFTGVASNFNEGTPRAIQAGITAGGTNMAPGTYYLVLKSALLALNTKSVGRWGFVNYTSDGSGRIHSPSDPRADVALRPTQDLVVTLLAGFSANGTESRKLLTDSTYTTPLYYKVPSTYIPPSNGFKPLDGTQTVLAYAIGDGSQLNMPYNRADYYVYRPPATDPKFPMPASCSPGTGILFKAVAGQAAASYTGNAGESLIYPLLNCVGDMRVVLGLDAGNGGGVVPYDPISPALYPTSPTSGLTGDIFRSQLKEARVYILAHEGKKDMNYTYPGDSIYVGEPGFGGKNWLATQLADATAFGADWRHYRWKVYSLVVQLKNVQ